MIRHISVWILVAFLVACSSSSGDDVQDAQQTADVMDNTSQLDSTVESCESDESCDDNDPCTTDDQCVDGACQGTPMECPEVECAATTCNADGTCGFGDVEQGSCFVEGECYQDGATSPDETCLVCNAQHSQTNFSYAEDGTPCEDGNICTEDDVCESGQCVRTNPPTCADGVMCTEDVCDPVEGCIRTQNHEMCDDDNPCTADVCDMELGCTNTPDDTLTCGDGNVCTINERCVDGECITDGNLDCSDENICTDEFCHESFGCLYVFNTEPCDDGAGCTQNDTCHYGTCRGEEGFTACPLCDPEFADTSFKINSLRIGAGGHPGEALNVDNDLKTCSPNEDCEQGLDNTLSFAGELLDEMLAENISLEAESPVIIISEMKDFNTEGNPFSIMLYYGGLDPSNPECDYQSDPCKYRLSPSNFDDLCNPYIKFDNAVYTDGVITAGGSGYVFVYEMDFAGGNTAEAVLFNAMVEANAQFDEDDNMVGYTGVIGGAVTPENLAQLIDAIPAEFFPDGSKDAVLGLIDMMPMDIDVNGDGEYDALSMSFVVGAIPATILPYYY